MIANALKLNSHQNRYFDNLIQSNLCVSNISAFKIIMISKFWLSFGKAINGDNEPICMSLDVIRFASI